MIGSGAVAQGWTAGLMDGWLHLSRFLGGAVCLSVYGDGLLLAVQS